MSKRPMAQTVSESAGISKQLFFLGLAVMAVVGFVAGTRSDAVLAAVGPVIGLKVPHGAIDLSSVDATYKQLSANYDGKLDTQKLIDGANRGLVEAAGDRFTTYLDAKEAKQFSDDLSGDIGGGIGAEIAVRSEQATITRILPGNPAEKSGLKMGDSIVSINGQSTKGWTAEKTALQIRGSVGSTVKLVIARDGAEQEFSLTRQEVNNPSVQEKVEGEVGILTISRFDDQTGTLARRAAENLVNRGVKSVILDLRDNGGGYVDAAQQVASLWLDNQTVVSERTGGKVTDTVKSDSDPVFKSMPTIVLVNANTASASEIVAGALRDYDRATLVGEKTFGKGTMQQIIKLDRGAELKVTIAHWFTPRGHSLNNNGLKPDTVIGLTKDDANAGRDPQMAAALVQANK